MLGLSSTQNFNRRIYGLQSEKKKTADLSCAAGWFRMTFQCAAAGQLSVVDYASGAVSLLRSLISRTVDCNFASTMTAEHRTLGV